LIEANDRWTVGKSHLTLSAMIWKACPMPVALPYTEVRGWQLVRRLGLVLVLVALSGCSSGTTSAGLDRCLIGKWTELGETIVTTDDGSPVFLKGHGRVLDFATDGYETVNYNSASPLTGIVGGQPYVDIQRGTIRYRVTTQDGIMTFSDDDFSHFHQSVTIGGVPVASHTTDASPVQYTCSGNDQTQTNNAGTGGLFKRAQAG
jgi:hypothetical protein